jgi:hypothetical protein
MKEDDMLSRRSRRFLIIALSCIVILPISLWAVPGDCNGDASVGTPDAVMIVNYLINNGTLGPNPADCDCDGHPGITMGDALQVIGAGFYGCLLFPSPGTDQSVPSRVKFYYNSRVDFGATPTPKSSVDIYVNVPAGFDIEAFYVPFSFAADPGGQVLDVANIDYTGTVAADISTTDIDNVNKNFVIGGGATGTVTALPGGTNGKLCTVRFNLVSQPTDNPTGLEITATSHFPPMLIHQVCYGGIDLQRVFLPEFMRAPYGDVNSDQTCNVSDAVWIINYIFVGGLRPGDREPW